MATLAHDVTRYIAREWDAMYGSAVLSGIVGDPAHQARGGYHISIENNPSGNYSIVRPDDKAPPGNWPRNLAAAIDMSMNPQDMKLCSDRLWVIWNNTSDPRRQYINAFNGWFNDGGPAKRYDFVTQKISDTTSDHKWHVHLEIRRKWVTSMTAANAILSALRGETVKQYLDSLQGVNTMFCQKGDKNGQVGVMQNEVNQVLTDMGVPPEELLITDTDYGAKTAAGLLRSGCGNPDNNGEVYWAGEYLKLSEKLRNIAAKKAVQEHLTNAEHEGGPGGLVQHTHAIPNLSVSITGSGSTSNATTGEAVPS